MADVIELPECVWSADECLRPARYEALDPADNVGWLPMCAGCAEETRRTPGNERMILRTRRSE